MTGLAKIKREPSRAEEDKKMTQTTDISKETWFNKKWRPAMAWSYMVICLFDFIIAPILWSILQTTYKGNITEAWQPLTLQGAGLFHLAMGAILGVTAWSRGQEKMGTTSSMYTHNPRRQSQRFTDEENFEERSYSTATREDR